MSVVTFRMSNLSILTIALVLWPAAFAAAESLPGGSAMPQRYALLTTGLLAAPFKQGHAEARYAFDSGVSALPQTATTADTNAPGAQDSSKSDAAQTEGSDATSASANRAGASQPMTGASSTTSHSRGPRLGIGPEFGFYLPTDSKARSRFGSAWPIIGVGFGKIDAADPSGGIGFDLAMAYRQNGDHHAFLAPIGIQYRKALGSSPSSSVPYAGISADLVLIDVRSPEDNIHSGLTTAAGGSIFTGVTFQKSGYVEARYQAVSTARSFNLSGLSLNLGIRF